MMGRMEEAEECANLALFWVGRDSLLVRASSMGAVRLARDLW